MARTVLLLQRQRLHLAGKTRTGVSAPHKSGKRKRPRSVKNVAFINAGDDLLSHTLSRTVQSALRGLTSVFGMGTGGTPAVRSPQIDPRYARAIGSWLLVFG